MRTWLVRLAFLSCLTWPSLHVARSSAPLVPQSAAINAQAAASSALWEDLEGVASWYSTADVGVAPHTASTELFDDRALTCAMWGVPFNTRLKVTNRDTGHAVVVRVNDRGPAEDLVLTQHRVIDLTKTAFAAIADPAQGLIQVRVELERPLLSLAH